MVVADAACPADSSMNKTKWAIMCDVPSTGKLLTDEVSRNMMRCKRAGYVDGCQGKAGPMPGCPFSTH